LKYQAPCRNFCNKRLITRGYEKIEHGFLPVAKKERLCGFGAKRTVNRNAVLHRQRLVVIHSLKGNIKLRKRFVNLLLQLGFEFGGASLLISLTQIIKAPPRR
jgi:hypothetical protein